MSNCISSAEITMVRQRVTAYLRWKHRGAPLELIEDAVADTIANWWESAPQAARADASRVLRWVIPRANTHLIDLIRHNVRSGTLSEIHLSKGNLDEQIVWIADRQESD